MTHPIIIGFVVDHFNLPASKRKANEDYSRDGAVKPAAVWTALQRHFGVPEIREAVLDCLRETGDADWTGRKIDQRQVEVLTRGVRTADNDAARSSGLPGAELYRWKVRHRAPPEKLGPRLTDFEQEIRRFRDATDPLVSECAADARSASWVLRRNRPDLTKPAPEAFKAYRVEDRTSVSHAIEREDGIPSMRVPRLEVTERTLYVDFEDLDPAVLPKDAPALIEDVLLGRYAEWTYSSAADKAIFTNLGDKKRLAVTRPLPRRAHQ